MVTEEGVVGCSIQVLQVRYSLGAANPHASVSSSLDWWALL